MSISDEEYRGCLSRHSKNMSIIDIKEDLVLTLYRLGILSRKQYSTTRDILNEEYDMELVVWHSIKDEYYNNMRS